MKVILTKDVSGLGRAGDIKEVSDGYFRNFLMPKHVALPATSSALQKLQKEESERQAKIQKLQDWLDAMKNKLESKVFNYKAKAEKNTLFASVHAEQIANVVNGKLNLELTPDQIILTSPIKTLGLHEVQIKFDPKTLITIKVNIENI